MPRNNLSKFGGTLAILIGLFLITATIIHAAVLDRAQAPALDVIVPDADSFFPSIAAEPWPFRIQSLLFALVGLFGFAVIPAVSEALDLDKSPWANWASKLAYLGFAVYALSQIRALALFPVLGDLYAGPEATEATRIAVTIGYGLVNLDPTAIFSLGLIGFWILIVSLHALRSGAWPKVLSYLGIADSILLGIFIFGVTTGSKTLVDIVAGLAIGLLPVIWFIWVGRSLRKLPNAIPLESTLS